MGRVGLEIHDHLARIFGGGTLGGLTDGQLLERFLRERDELAFELLVRRHGPMVRGVCLGVLGCAAEADDAFQAAFLVLVRKGGSVRGRDSLGGWLHRVALRVALRARRRRARGEAVPLEGEALRDPAVTAAEAALERERRLVVRQEVDRLPERYRGPVVLCDLEGLTHEEAAARLACPVGTVKGRLFRARERLRGRLERLGLGPVAAGAVVPLPLGDTSRAVVSEALARQTIRAALVVVEQGTAAAVSAGAVPVAVGILATGAVRAMTGKTLATALGGLVLTGTLAGGLASLGAGGDDPAPGTGQAAAAAATGEEGGSGSAAGLSGLGDGGLTGAAAGASGSPSGSRPIPKPVAQVTAAEQLATLRRQEAGLIDELLKIQKALRNLMALEYEARGGGPGAVAGMMMPGVGTDAALPAAVSGGAEGLSAGTGARAGPDPFGLPRGASAYGGGAMGSGGGLPGGMGAGLERAMGGPGGGADGLEREAWLTGGRGGDGGSLALDAFGPAPIVDDPESELIAIEVETDRDVIRSLSRQLTELELQPSGSASSTGPGNPQEADTLRAVRIERLQRQLLERKQRFLDRAAELNKRRQELAARNAEAKAQPAKAYTLQPGDRLTIDVLEALPGRPLGGERVVRPDGTIHLGFYGELPVAGLTAREAKERLVLHLRKYMSAEGLGLEVEDAQGNPTKVAPADSDRVFVDDSVNFLKPTEEGDRQVSEVRQRLDRLERMIRGTPGPVNVPTGRR